MSSKQSCAVKENVEHFLKAKQKNCTLFSLRQVEDPRQKIGHISPPTPFKKEDSLNCKGSRRPNRGLTQRQRELLGILKGELSWYPSSIQGDRRKRYY